MAITALKPSMRTLGALLITLSLITPASSVFIIAPGVVQQAGTGAFLAFGLAAAVGILTAFVYAELASAFPWTGGEYAIIGRVMGNSYGIVALGVNLITNIFSISALSLGLSGYLKPVFPDSPQVATGIGAVVLASLCGMLHIRTNAIVTGLFLGIELIALSALTYFGLHHTERSLTDLVMTPMHMGGGNVLEPTSLSMIGLATTVAIWAYNGYGQAVYLGEEMHNAPKRIARTIFLALVITVIAEAIPVTAVLLGAPDLKSLFASQDMFGDFLSLRGGQALGLVISLGIALAIFNAVIALIVMLARNIYSTGRDNVWTPSINKALTSIHDRFHSPWIATLVCGGLGAAACFINQKFLFVATGTGLVVIYALLSVTVIVGRRSGATAHAPYKMPLYPVIPILAVVMMGYVIYANFLDPDIGRPSLLATTGMIIISLLYYFVVLRRRSGWILRGPEN